MPRKAEVLEAQWRAERTPPGSTSGACAQRGSLGTCENRHFLAEETGEARRNRKWPVGVRVIFAPGFRAREGTRTKRMDPRYREATRDGEAVVLAEHSTDG